VVFAAGSAIDGSIELNFHAWEIGRFGDRVNIPYHVRLSLEACHNMPRPRKFLLKFFVMKL
jgi:hypothetical protein